MKKRIMLGLAAILALGLLAGCSSEGPASTPVPIVDESTGAISAAVPTVTVQGEGELKLTPDKATMEFGVEMQQQETAEGATAAMNEALAKVADALKALGVADEDIQTSRFSLYESYRYDDNGNIIGKPRYTASSYLTVTIYDVDNTGKYIDAAVAAGATNTGGITFGMKDEQAHELAALDLAMANARERAEALAKASGRTLGDVLIVTDGTSVKEEVYYDDARAAVPEMSAMDSAGASLSYVAPGQTTVTARVSVRFTMN